MTEDKALAIAEAQRKNQLFRQPLDYGAIIEGRRVAPTLFAGLPSDAECKQKLTTKPTINH